jgi:serine/threonine protein kinase
MQKMDSTNIVKFKEVIENGSNYYIIMELCPEGTLEDHI